jgi:Aspartyl protease
VIRRRTLDIWLFCMAAALAATGAPTAIPPVRAEDAPAVIERFKVHGDGDALLLPVTVVGKTCLFVFDTGSTNTVFDSSLPLGKPTEQQPARTGYDGISGDTISVSLFDTPATTLGKFDLKAVLPKVIGVDLSRFRDVSGEDIYGILGMDFLRRHVVRIDFDMGVLTFLKSADPTVGKAVKLQIVNGTLPAANVVIQSHGEEQFCIDSGFSSPDSGTLNPRLYATMIQSGDYRVGNSLIVSASGMNARKTIRGKGISAAGYSLRNPAFSEGTANRLSTTWLSRFNVTLDFPNSRMYLQKSKSFDRTDQSDLSGLHFLRKDGETTVDAVDRYSPAVKAGLQAGDMLLQVANRNARATRLFLLRRSLCEEGAVRVIAKRQDKEIDVTLNLK